MRVVQFDNETDLITAFKQEDKQAIAYLFKKFYSLLVDYANILIKDSAQAEDIVFDVFLKLMRKKRDFDNLSDIKSFLYVATKNDCFDYLRHKKVHDRFQNESLYLSRQDTETIGTNDIALIEAELIHAIHEEVKNLPAKCRKIFEMRFFKGMTNQQIAEELGISEENIRNQHSNAFQKLRIALLEKGQIPALVFLTIHYCNTGNPVTLV